jgi:hypothetical protein
MEGRHDPQRSFILESVMDKEPAEVGLGECSVPIDQLVAALTLQPRR